MEKGEETMRRFLAGLAIALAAAIVLQSRRRGGEERILRSREGDKYPGADQRTEVAGQPRPQQQEKGKSPRVSGPTAVVSGAEPARQEQTPSPATGRSAEDVLNSATRQQLMSVYGIGPVLADRIIQNRPYAAAHDVVEQGIIPENTFVHLRKQLLEQSA
jgi:DNA uptake protein ComE-like DNA-binding protein